MIRMRPRQAAFLRVAVVSTTPMMSDSFMIRRSWPSILTSVPLHLPKSTRSPTLLDVEGDELAGLVTRAGADGDDFALLGLFLGGLGDDDATLGLFLAVEAADHDAVMQRTELHGSVFLLSYSVRAPLKGPGVRLLAVLPGEC